MVFKDATNSETMSLIDKKVLLGVGLLTDIMYEQEDMSIMRMNMNPARIYSSACTKREKGIR